MFCNACAHAMHTHPRTYMLTHTCAHIHTTHTCMHHTPHTPSCYPHTHTVSPAPPSPVPTLGGRTVPQMARVRLCQSGGPQKKPPMNDSPGLAVAPERLLSCPVLLLGGRAGCLQQGAGLRLRAPEPWAGGGGRLQHPEQGPGAERPRDAAERSGLCSRRMLPTLS